MINVKSHYRKTKTGKTRVRPYNRLDRGFKHRRHRVYFKSHQIYPEGIEIQKYDSVRDILDACEYHGFLTKGTIEYFKKGFGFHPKRLVKKNWVLIEGDIFVDAHDIKEMKK